MKNKYLFILILFISILLDPVRVSCSIAGADSAYNAGDYLKAIELFKAYEQQNGISAPLLFNLGNAYYQNSDYGNAMLCYERAHKLDPSDKDIEANINFLNNKIQDSNRAKQKGKKMSVEEDEPTFFQNIHNAIAVEVYSDRWAVWSVVGFILFLTCALVYIFTQNVTIKKIGFFGGFTILGLTVICIIFACIGSDAFKTRETGIIMAYETSLYIEPGSDSETLEGNILTKGTKVRVISEETDATGNILWYKVRLNSNYIGWIKAQDLEVI